MMHFYSFDNFILVLIMCVVSILQDTWLPEQVAFVRAVGNVRGCAFYEAQLPSDFQRPAEADMLALRIFITDKYVNRKYCAQGFKDPPTIENYTTHPVSSLFGSLL